MHAWRCSLVLLALGLVCGAVRAAEAPRPNIILIITDDQGYGDLACHGNPSVQTPNLDALAAESVRLTNFHVSPTCAPTRCALMTGRHEFHSGVTHTINERERMALTATTYPQLLNQAGYATGIFGKWHLGDESDYQPNRRGFSEVFIHGAGGIGQTFPGSCGDAPKNSYFHPAILHNGKFEKTQKYCTDVFFEQALTWIDKQRASGPFYAHIATNAPHTPLDCPPEYEQKYAHLNDPKRAKFYGMITNIDDNVGRLRTKLKEWRLDRDTLLIFMTDNGGTGGVQEFNDGMRGAKVTPWEGGIRVPCLVKWGDRFPAGDRSQLTAHVDLFPTLTGMAGAKVPPEVAARLEGRDLLPVLKSSESPWENRIFVAHMGRWPKGQVAAAKYSSCSIRDERYAMVSPGKEKAWQLFDLKSDPGQQTDILAQHPDVASRLEMAYDRWWESIQPGLVNEDAIPPAENPFKTLYYEQFPSER
ncbi:MAG: arylsulfatase [Planctomycetaceae bacterium]